MLYTLLPRYWVMANGKYFPLGNDVVKAIQVEAKLYQKYPRMTHGVCTRQMLNVE